MGLRDSLESKAKKWALDKANDLLGDKNQSGQPAAPPPPPPAPPPSADQQAVADAQAAAGEKMVRSLIPGLGQWADEQQARHDQRQAAEAVRQRAAIDALPRGQVRIRLTGDYEATWWGELPVRLETKQDEITPRLEIELTTQPDERPMLGERPMVSWLMTVPTYTGDGTYDLVALNRAREADGIDVLFENVLDLGDEDGEWTMYSVPDVGPSTVSVNGSSISASLSMGAAIGNTVGTVEITLPATATAPAATTGAAAG